MTSKCKVVFLGAAGTGKTSLIHKFIYDDFSRDYSATVGIDFFTKPVQVADRTINLQIWDTAGQEKFKSLIPSYIRESSIAVIVYDVSDIATFEEAKSWQKTVENERGNEAVCILVGNKIDLENQVPREKVIEFTRPLSISAIEASAKTGKNIARLFKLISESIPNQKNLPQNDIPIIVPQSEQPPPPCSC